MLIRVDAALAEVLHEFATDWAAVQAVCFACRYVEVGMARRADLRGNIRCQCGETLRMAEIKEVEA